MKNTTSTMANIMIVLISSTALISWEINHASLSNILPGIESMTFNTALSFLLIASICLLPKMHLLEGYALRSIVGVVVGLFAMLSLSQDIFCLTFGIDNLLFNSHFYTYDHHVPHPGRMSPITATGFILSGMFLLMLTPGRLRTGQFTAGTKGMPLVIILLLLMVPILGLGMNFLITDIPPFLAHSVSISTFTSISFILMVNVFLVECGVTFKLS